jgi:ribosome assembly protein YihI (activator of Der GTPase)
VDTDAGWQTRPRREELLGRGELRERRNADARVEQLEARINALLDALDGGTVRQMLSAMSELRERRNADARVEQLEARINALLDALDGGATAVEPPPLKDDV